MKTNNYYPSLNQADMKNVEIDFNSSDSTKFSTVSKVEIGKSEIENDLFANTDIEMKLNLFDKQSFDHSPLMPLQGQSNVKKFNWNDIKQLDNPPIPKKRATIQLKDFSFIDYLERREEQNNGFLFDCPETRSRSKTVFTGM